MNRTLRVLMRRDPSRDRQDGPVRLEGYATLWPDGRPLGIGFDAFCRQGLWLFGLGRQPGGCRERLVDMTYHPLAGLEDPLTRLPGQRVRRFFLRRDGRLGRLHFFNGTATAIALDLDRDEQAVLDWIGLPALADGESAWFDLAAHAAEAAGPPDNPEPRGLPAPVAAFSPGRRDAAPDTLPQDFAEQRRLPIRQRAGGGGPVEDAVVERQPHRQPAAGGRRSSQSGSWVTPADRPPASGARGRTSALAAVRPLPARGRPSEQAEGLLGGRLG